VSAEGTRTPPEPGFRLCNHSRHVVLVAKAINLAAGGGTDILSEGWWRVGSGTCLTLYPGPLRYRCYLVYAEVVGPNLSWSGDVGVCVSQQPFRIRSGLCGEGYNRRMFRQIDTGGNPIGYTYDLTD
jgi:uncharacterized membrane protein